MLQLTIQEAAASTNIWFKVESEEQQRMFQEEFFRQGGKWVVGTADIDIYEDCKMFELTEEGLTWCHVAQSDVEQVQILWQEEEPSIVIDSLAPEVTLKAILKPTVPYDDFIRLLQQIEHDTLAKDFISDKCLRKLLDSQLASLARFLLTTKNYLTKRTKQLEYRYNFYRKEVENIVRQCQAGLYQEELKQSPEWEGLSWERRGEV